MYLDLAPAPSWLNSGDTAWQLVAATLVGLMSVPGLAILYAGLMKRKWAVNSSLMVLYGFGATLVVWSFWGYKMAFGTQITDRSEEHTSELQSRGHLVCRLLLEKKKASMPATLLRFTAGWVVGFFAVCSAA